MTHPLATGIAIGLMAGFALILGCGAATTVVLERRLRRSGSGVVT